MTTRLRAALTTGISTALLCSAGLVAAPAAQALTHWGTSSCAPVDTVAPWVSSLQLSTGAVDVRSGAKTVTVTAKVADFADTAAHRSGVKTVTVQLMSPLTGGIPSTATATLKLTGGTKMDGTWTGTATVNRWVKAGTWNVSSVTAADAAGNEQSYVDLPGGMGGPTAIAAQDQTKWDRTLTVQSTPDTTPPALNGFGMTPVAVNTTAGTKTVVVTANVTDTQSGVQSVWVSIAGPKPGQGTGAVLTYNAPSKKWTGKAVVPRWVGNATWKVSVIAMDKAGNYASWADTVLAGKKWPSKLTVTSGTDTGKPSVSKFGFTPSSVNVATKNGVVTATVGAGDALSGVAQVKVTFTHRNAKGVVDGQASGSLKLVGGSAKSGTWSGKVVVPHCSVGGTWTASVQVTDAARNTTTLAPAALASKKWPTKLTVATAKPLDTTDPSVTGGTISGGNLVLTFSEDVRGVTGDNVLVYDMFGAGSTAVTVSSCVDASGATVSCATGKVRKVTLTPTTPFGSYAILSVYVNARSVTGQVRDTVGNPVGWSTATSVMAGF